MIVYIHTAFCINYDVSKINYKIYVAYVVHRTMKIREKGRYLSQSYDKSPLTHRKFNKNNVTTQT